MSTPGKLHLNINILSSGFHGASWRSATGVPDAFISVDHYVRTAKIAERGAFDAVFLADTPSVTDQPGYRPFLALEPTIADWFAAGAADGFNLMPDALPDGLETLVDHVVPILRRKGIFREAYEAATLREHFGLARPVNQFSAARAAAAE
jgi:alkanesulfonate monooxygenase SsuD/methylene tetrahydromethanopterin reductase-like flavin-dependent oxidoreductase (luciferase family)